MALIKEIASENQHRKIEIYRNDDSGYFSFEVFKLIKNEENTHDPGPVWIPFRSSGMFETLSLLEDFIQEEFEWLNK